MGTLPLAATTTGRVYISQNACGSNIADLFTLGTPAFESAALPSFQSSNLNYYHSLDGFNFQGGNSGGTLDYFLTYASPIIVSPQLHVMMTERGGNNGKTIQALACPANPSLPNTTGVAVTQNADAYANNTNARLNSDGQTAMASIFPATDLVAAGTSICGFRVTFQGGEQRRGRA